MTEATPAFRTGGRAAAERAAADKEARDKKRASGFNTWEYLRLDPAEKGEVYGGSVIIRMVTPEPEWIEVKQHSFVNTKDAPKDIPAGRKWPKAMGAVCRYTVVPKADGTFGPWYDDCVIDDLELAKGEGKNGPYTKKASPRLWAVAVEREEYTTDDGETSYRDVMIQHTEDGKTTEIPKFLVLNFGTTNFFDAFLGFDNVYHTVLDRDYKITRVGSGTDTDYNIVSLDPVQTVENGKVVKLIPHYDVPFDLAEIVAEQASSKHYDWFFNPNVESSWVERFGVPKDENGNEVKADAKTEEAAADEEKSKETLEAMRKRLLDSKRAKADA